jgi:hypothetical protein
MYFIKNVVLNLQSLFKVVYSTKNKAQGWGNFVFLSTTGPSRKHGLMSYIHQHKASKRPSSSLHHLDASRGEVD